MTQVWMVRNSDTDIHLFNRYEHLEPSVRTTFCRCEDVKVTVNREATSFRQSVTFTITGKRDGIAFTDTVIATCYPVWTEPSHL